MHMLWTLIINILYIRCAFLSFSGITEYTLFSDGGFGHFKGIRPMVKLKGGLWG